MNEARATSEVQCAIHNVVETAYTDTYRECGECWHVFQTEQDLLDAACKTIASFKMSHEHCPRSGDVIFSCPLCGHDF